MNLKLLILSGLLCILSSYAFSQDEDVTIEEIIISEETENDILNQQVKFDQINMIHPGSTGEVFDNISGMNVLKRSKFAIEPSLRMFKREQLNLMIDGGTKITHSCANRMDAMTTRLSATEISKIEIIKGPYSVRYGQSMGGIINIITKQHTPSEQFKFSGGGDVAYEFNGSGISSGLEFGGSGEKFNFLLSGSYRDFDNYESGDNSEIVSSFKAYDYSAKLGYALNKQHKIQASFRHSMAQDVLHAGLPMDALDDDGKLFSLDYSYLNQKNLLSSIKVKLYGSDVDHLMTNEWKANYEFVEALASVESQTYGGKAEFSFNLNDDILLHTGVDYIKKSRDGQRDRLVKINACSGIELPEPTLFTDKIWQRSYSNDYGIFAEIDYAYNEKVKLKAGIRNDFVQKNITDPEEDFSLFYEENIIPEDQNTIDFFAKANIKLPGNFNLSLAAGKASRSPDLLELFINHLSVGQDAYEYLGNPNLEPEKNFQTDLALTHKGSKHFVYANLFYSYIQDFITAAVDTTIPRKFLPCKQPPYTKVFTNADEVYQYGINAGFHMETLKLLFLSADVMYIFAQNISWDEPVPEIAPFTIKGGLSYFYKSFKFFLGNRFVFAQERIAESFGESVSEAFNVLDMSIFFKPIDQITFGFAVDNILDENYYEHTGRPYKNLDESSLFYEPGRNFKLSLKFRF
jgi:iron complex outermembrane receptor protein